MTTEHLTTEIAVSDGERSGAPPRRSHQHLNPERDEPRGPGPIVFHHVQKTGGNTVIQSILPFVSPDDAISDKGNLTVPLIQGMLTRGLRSSQVLYGHADRGVCALLRGKARIITMLREPSQQIVSHYLHLQREPADQMHFAAKELVFSEFLTIYKWMLAFQTISLLVGITSRDAPPLPPRLVDKLITALPQVFAYLDEMFVVGTLDNLEQFLFILSAEMCWPTITRPLHLNRAQNDQRDKAPMLRSQLEDLSYDDPECALLLSLERSVYLKVSALERQARDRFLVRRMLDMRKQPDSGVLAHDSPNGQIIMGKNLIDREFLDNGGVGWWTGPSEFSQIFVRPIRLIRKVTAEVRLWHFVNPNLLHASIDGRQAAIEVRNDDGCHILEINLTDMYEEMRNVIEIQLHISWSGHPNCPPAFPRILLTNLNLI